MSIVRPVSLTSSESTTGNSPGRVLVAEDDAMFRRILQKWLENWGYQVILAEDGGGSLEHPATGAAARVANS